MIVSSPTVIWPSCMASSKALWTLAGAPVDLVGQKHAGHDRAGSDVERAGRGTVNLRAGQVCRAAGRA